MKKKMHKKAFAAALFSACIILSLLPVVTRAAVTPYFVAVNNTVLPLDDSIMPYISGGDYFIPISVFAEAGVDSFNPGNSDTIIMFNKGTKTVFFYVLRGITEDQDGNLLTWPSAKKVGNRYYVPLRQVCTYFGLSYEIIEVPLDVIPNEQMYVVRVISSGDAFNWRTFLGYNTQALKSAYSTYYSPPTPTPPSPVVTGTESPPTVTPVELPPRYNDITIYLSYYDLSAGNSERILQLVNVTQNYSACFFVSTSEIAENPDLIRKIHGSGATIGIWLLEGTYEEYQEAEALLFEAVKIKTVIVSAGRDQTESESESPAAEMRTAIGNTAINANENTAVSTIGNANDNTYDETVNEEADEDIYEDIYEDSDENLNRNAAVKAAEMAEQHGLLFWDALQDYGKDEELSVDSVTDALPTASGAYENIRFDCSEDTVAILPAVFSWLSDYEYSVGTINETVGTPPINGDR